MPLVARAGTVIVHEEPTTPDLLPPDPEEPPPEEPPPEEIASASEDGILIATQFTVLAEGIAVGRVGDACSIHVDDGGVVVPNDSTVLVGGLQIARVGDKTSCSPPGTLDIEGSALTVYADGQ
jgi:uncharacterized Zn-binding protein involved in type VI secretion